MPAVQVQSSLGRRREHRHFHGRDDLVRARGGRFLGGMVRAVSDDLARARGPRQESRGTPEGREGRRRRESRTRHEVWRAVDPVAGRDPGRARDRPNCRRASSRCAGAAIAASARRLSVDPGSTLRGRGVSPGAELARTAGQRGPRGDCEGCNAWAPTRRRPGDAHGRIRFVTPPPSAGPIVTTGSFAIRLVRSTADGQTNPITRARFVESRMSPGGGPSSGASRPWRCISTRARPRLTRTAMPTIGMREMHSSVALTTAATTGSRVALPLDACCSSLGSVAGSATERQPAARLIDCSSCLIAAAVRSERPEARNPGFGAARERVDDRDRERRFTRIALQPWKGALPVSSCSDDDGAETCPSSPDGTPDHPLRVMLGPGAPTTVAGIHRALAGASDGRGRPVKGDAPRCASGFLCSFSPRRSS